MCSHQVQRSRISGGRLGSPQTHHTYCLLDLGDILEPLPPSTCPSVKWDDGDVNKAGWGLKLILHRKARPRVGSGRPLGTLLLHPAACRARGRSLAHRGGSVAGGRQHRHSLSRRSPRPWRPQARPFPRRPGTVSSPHPWPPAFREELGRPFRNEGHTPAGPHAGGRLSPHQAHS